MAPGLGFPLCCLVLSVLVVLLGGAKSGTTCVTILVASLSQSKWRRGGGRDRQEERLRENFPGVQGLDLDSSLRRARVPLAPGRGLWRRGEVSPASALWSRVGV